MTYATFLQETYQALRLTIPAQPCGAAWDAWLDGVGAVLLDLAPGAQLQWMQRYAVLVLIAYGNLLPCRAEAYLVSGLVRAADQRVRELSQEVPALMAEVQALRLRVDAARRMVRQEGTR